MLTTTVIIVINTGFEPKLNLIPGQKRIHSAITVSAMGVRRKLSREGKDRYCIIVSRSRESKDKNALLLFLNSTVFFPDYIVLSILGGRGIPSCLLS